MTKTIEERMLSIEQELSEIRKEMEEEVGRYKQSQYPFDVDKIKNLLRIEGDWFNNGSVGQPWKDLPKTKCLWQSIPEEDRMKPLGLSCPCAKCSAWC